MLKQLRRTSPSTIFTLCLTVIFISLRHSERIQRRLAEVWTERNKAYVSDVDVVFVLAWVQILNRNGSCRAFKADRYCRSPPLPARSGRDPIPLATGFVRVWQQPFGRSARRR